MKKEILLIILAILFSTLPTGLASAASPPPTLPGEPTVPDSLGVNIHFTHPVPGEIEMLAASGVKWVRMDLIWQNTEMERGKYDFSAYDHLIKHLEAHGLNALFILDDGNPLDDGGKPPFTEAGRQAFAKWASAAALHFKGRGIIWELWNEPNIKIFWPPRSNVQDYIRLAENVGLAFQAKAPGEILIGPAISKVNEKFLRECLKGGLLRYFSAVSVHPYRLRRMPETVIKDYKEIKNWIRKYSPEGKHVALLSGEWGYPSVSGKLDETKQAQFLARMWLTNLAEGIPLSIWYDWRDDGLEPKNNEHHFGLVKHVYREKTNPPFEPKPAYWTAQNLSKTLGGFRFSRRIKNKKAGDWILEFQNGSEHRWAAWTTGRHSRLSHPALPPGRYLVVDMTGEAKSIWDNSQGDLALELSPSPIYLIPQN